MKSVESTGTTEFSAKQNYIIPLSSGILEHREAIGGAIWLFILLIDWTTREENGIGKVLGGKPIKLRDLANALRIQERQISSQLQRLQTGKYIRLRRTPYGYSIEVLKSKKFINRDRQKIAALYTADRQKIADPDRQQTADHCEEIGNNVQERSATNCRCNKDITVDFKERAAESDKPILIIPSHRGNVSKSLNLAEPEAFKTFYELFPRHVARQKALQAWLRLHPSDQLIKAIMASVSRYAGEVEGTEPRFILHPATWLNGRRWEDEWATRNGNTQHIGGFVG